MALISQLSNRSDEEAVLDALGRARAARGLSQAGYGAAYADLVEAMAARRRINLGSAPPDQTPVGPIIPPNQSTRAESAPPPQIQERDRDPGNVQDIGPIPSVAEWQDIPRGMLAVAGPLGGAGVIGGLALSHATGQRVTPSFSHAIAGLMAGGGGKDRHSQSFGRAGRGAKGTGSKTATSPSRGSQSRSNTSSRGKKG